MIDFKQALTLPSGVTIKNRLVMAPMTVVLSFHNGIVTKEEIEHYARRARGLGMVITGTANVTPNGKGWPGELKVSDDEAIPQLSKLAKAIQAQGAKAILQIFHAGRLTQASTIGEQVVSASAIPAEGVGFEVPRALTEPEILTIIDDFGKAARRAMEAGFDGVEIHGANMYLIHQFFSPHSNRREDAWGGNLQKRMTFPLAVVDRVLEEVKHSADRPFIVGYRFSPVEGTSPGIRFEDTLELLSALTRRPLDYVHESLKDFKRQTNSPDYQEKSTLAYTQKALAGKLPLIGVGGVRTRADVESLLQHAELCAIGQQLLVDPDFPIKLAEERDNECVSKPFGEAIKEIDMPNPMFNYLKVRYQ